MKVLLIILIVLVNVAGVFGQESCGQTNNKKSLKLYKEALSFLNQEKYRSALNLLKEAVSKDESYAEAINLIAHIYSFQGNYSDSKKYFLEVLEICEDFDPEIYLSLAKIEFRLQHYPEAAVYAKQFLDYELLNEGLVEEADEIFERASFLDAIFKNPVPFDPKPVANICTEYDEYLPILTPDNDFLYFTRRHKMDSKFTVIGDAWVEEFCVAERKESDFEYGTPLKNPFNQSSNEGGASLSHDNKNLYITICNSPQGAGSCDIFTAAKENGVWSPLINIGSNVNDSLWQSQVSLAPDGKTLYFASDMEGGYGGKDIYSTVMDDNGSWSDPRNLGPTINTAEEEKSPFIHQDGITLYFSSTGHQSIGGFDIFVSRKESESWLEPFNIGYPINSDYDDLGFFVSTNGKTGYFASNKLEGEGGWDIYQFELYERARPKKVMFVKGSVKDEDGKVLDGAKIQLKDLKTKEVKNIEVDSITGEYVYSEIFENDKMLTVNSEGHMYGEKVITEDEIDNPGSIQFNARLDKIEVGSSFRLEKILFATDRYDLNSESVLSLDNLLEFLFINQKLQIEVAGHTDDIGDSEENKILSENRARVVYEYLIENGIDGSRMKFQGYGEDQPLIRNIDDRSRALNRRTEIRIIGNM